VRPKSTRKGDGDRKVFALRRGDTKKKDTLATKAWSNPHFCQGRLPPEIYHLGGGLLGKKNPG